MDLSELPEQDFLRHPWELARASFFLRELKCAGLMSGSHRVLDVGAGDAWFAGEMADANDAQPTVCWDIGYEQGTPSPRSRICYTVEKPSGEFDLLLMLDVAEHVRDDQRFLDDVLSCAAPGSHVLFSVPAWPGLYSNHDENLRHYRRYHPQQARELLEGAGLTVRRAGGIFHSLLLPRWLGMLKQSREPGQTFNEAASHVPEDLAWHAGRGLRSCVLAALAVDGRLSRAAVGVGLEVPGLGWWALCQKA